MCGVFGPDFGHFSNLPSRLKVNWLFKAELVAFRDSFRDKVEMVPFWTISEWELAVEMKPVF